MNYRKNCVFLTNKQLWRRAVIKNNNIVEGCVSIPHLSKEKTEINKNKKIVTFKKFDPDTDLKYYTI